MITSEEPKSKAELRKFGLIMFAGFGLIAGALWWFDKHTWIILAEVSGVFLLMALLVPKLLAPIEVAWMWFAEKINIVVTTMLMSITFFFVITPIGLIMKIVGKDPLNRAIEKDAETYWIPVPEDHPGTRPNLPY